MFTDAEGRLRPAWAFLLSASLSAVAFLISGYFAGALTSDHILRFEVIFRSCLAGLLSPDSTGFSRSATTSRSTGLQLKASPWCEDGSASLSLVADWLLYC